MSFFFVQFVTLFFLMAVFGSISLVISSGPFLEQWKKLTSSSEHCKKLLTFSGLSMGGTGNYSSAGKPSVGPQLMHQNSGPFGGFYGSSLGDQTSHLGGTPGATGCMIMTPLISTASLATDAKINRPFTIKFFSFLFHCFSVLRACGIIEEFI